jgi:signal recognition particle subunit SRP54
MIQSMTRNERSDPDAIDKSRAQRIARGSGRGLKEVEGLVERFGQMRQMMGALGGGGGMLSKIPGLGKLGGAGGGMPGFDPSMLAAGAGGGGGGGGGQQLRRSTVARQRKNQKAKRKQSKKDRRKGRKK